MTVESKIVFRSDSAEVRRSVADIKAAKAAMVGLQNGTEADPKIALERARGERQIAVERAKYDAKFGLAHQRAVAGVVERRQKSEIALETKKADASGKAALEAQRAEAKRVLAHDKAQSAMEARAKRGQAAARSSGKPAAAGGDAGAGGLSLTDLKSAYDVASPIAMKVGEVIYRAGAAVIQAQAFKEDVSRGFEIIAKSKAEGDRVLALSSKTADFIGQDRAAVAGQFLDLLTKGFQPEKVDEITRRLADLQTVDPRANLERLSRAIGQIAGKGRLQGQELLQLADAGLETGDVYKALAKNLGKSVPEIIKLQEAGKISSDVATQGILDAIAGQTGGKGAGEAARAKSLQDLSGLIRRIEAIPANLLFGMDAGPGLEKTKAKMREIIEFFDSSSESGKETRKVLGDTFNAFAEGLFGIDASRGGGIKATLQAIVDVVKNSKDDIKNFGKAINSVASGIAAIGSVVSAFTNARQAMADFFGFQPPGGVWGMILLGPVYAAAQELKELAPEFYAAGANLINGLIDGIKSAVGGVWSAAQGAAQGAVDAVKSLWKTHSPSKVAFELGGYYGAGLGGGIANDNSAERAAQTTAKDTVGATAAGLGTAVAPMGALAGLGRPWLTFAPVIHLPPGSTAETKAAVETALGEAQARWEAHAAIYFGREAQAA